MAVFKPSELWCQGCGRMISINNFYRNNNEYHKYKAHYYCKECTKKISKEIMAKHCKKITKDNIIGYEMGIRHICSFFDMPFITEVCVALRDFELSGTKEKNWDYVVQYGRKLKELGYDKEEYWNDFSENNFLAMDIINDRETKHNSDGDAELFINLRKQWGIQDSLDDYLFLEERFNAYSEGETLSASMINTLRYLCSAELDVSKLKSSKTSDQKEISTAEKRVMDYYSRLKLDDFKFDKQKSAEEKLIESWAVITEQTEPIEWEDENLKNRLGIDDDLQDIMRSYGNKLVDTKNYPNLSVENVNKKVNKKC